MTEIKVLEGRVAKAVEKVEKSKKTIERHQKQLDKKLIAIAKKGVDPTNLESSKRKEDGTGSDFYWDICEIECKQSDIKGATRNLKDAEQILENWNAKLNVEIEKERFIEGNAPQVIKDFLDDWKEKAYQWYVLRFDRYMALKKDLLKQVNEARIECVKTTSDYARLLDENGEVQSVYKDSLANIFPRTHMIAYLKERKLDADSVHSKLSSIADGVIMNMTTYYREEDRLAWLNKTLEADKKSKMLDLINRINSVVGSITDATGLRISEVGNLNGIIIGSKGSAKVETIGAGGYNIQCFHYRTLVKPIK